MIADLSFRTRLQAAFVIFAFGLTGGALLAMKYAALSAARDKAGADFGRALKSFERLANRRVDSLQELITAAVADPIFRAQVGRTGTKDADFGLGDSAAATTAMAEAHDILASAELPLFRHYPIFAILNDSGTLIYSQADPKRSGTQLAELPIVKKTLAGESALELWAPDSAAAREAGLLPATGEGSVNLVVGRQITSAGKLLGMALIGEPLESSMLPELEGFTFTRVGVFHDGGAFAAVPASRPALQELRAQVPPDGAVHAVDSAGERWLTQSDSLDRIGLGGKVILARKLADELGTFNDRVFRNILLFLAPVTLLALLIGNWIARRISAPMLQLSDAVQKVKAGNLAAKMTPTSRDEIGKLAEAFNEMTASLSQNRVDPLTGVSTQQFLIETLTYELLYASQGKKPLSLAALRMDGLPAAGDTRDEVLKKAAEVLRAPEHVRARDMLSRSSTDDFYLLLPETPAADAGRIAEAIQAAARAQGFKASIGVASLNAFISDVGAFLEAATRAVDDAAKSGGDQVVFSQGSLPKRMG